MTLNLDANSTASAKQEIAGQPVTDLYTHPLCQEIAAAHDGAVYTLWSKGVGSRRPQLTDQWRLLTTYCGAKFRPKQSIAIPAPVAKAFGTSHYRVLAGRFNLECYLGRTLDKHEVCRHGSLGSCDHSQKNLSVGCQLNNIIDEVEAGRILTTPDQLQIAINRLTNLLNESTT